MRHSGWYQEGSGEIILCLIDESYGDPEVEDEEAGSEQYRRDIEKEFGCEFESVDIFPGASGPAFLTILTEYAPALSSSISLSALLTLFFSGERLEKSFDAWIRMATRIKKFCTRQPIVSRNGAAILALDAVFECMGGLPTTVRLHAYNHFDNRFDSEAGTAHLENIEEPPAMEFLSATDHGFDIEADGERFRVVVSGVTATIVSRQ